MTNTTKKVTVSFSTLSGPKVLLWTVREALDSELASNVASLLADSAATGCTLNHPLYGRVTLEVVEIVGAA